MIENEPKTSHEDEAQGALRTWTTPRVEPVGNVAVEGAFVNAPTETGFGTFGPTS